MASVVHNITFGCADAYTLAQFWTVVTERPLADDDFPGDPEASIELESGVHLLFQQVPDPKTVKNRVHICLRPDVPRDEEVARLLAAGATLVDDQRRPDGTGWVVLGDPAGNEFCVERSAAQKAATA
jgi:hypothetical protein